jgi:hypothetical protein
LKKLKISKLELITFIVYAISIFALFIVFFSNRSLFLDSLNLARNIAEGSFVQLCMPLKYEQSAPVLFLLITRTITTLFGISEYTLRLLPLMAGLGTLFLFGKVLNLFLKSKYVIIGLLWLGTHATFLRYATEFKQYMSDAFVCILLIWLALKISELNNKNAFFMALIGSLAIWLSMPAIFALFGIVIYYLYNHYKEQRSMLNIFLLIIWFAANFSAEYYLILKSAIQSDQMQNFHNNYFLQGHFWSLESIQHDVGLLISTIRLAVGKSGLTISLAVFLIGVSIYKYIGNRKCVGLLLVIPILAVFGAALLGKYSMIERLMIFTMPIIFILILQGVQHVEEYLKTKVLWVKYSITGLFVLAFIVGLSQTHGLYIIFNPLEIEDNRSSLLHISKHDSSSNVIICSQFAFPAYEYYSKYDENYNDVKIGKARVAQYSDDLIKLSLEQTELQQNDVWLLLGHMNEEGISDLISNLEKVGTIKNSYRTNRAAAILFSTQ